MMCTHAWQRNGTKVRNLFWNDIANCNQIIEDMTDLSGFRHRVELRI